MGTWDSRFSCFLDAFWCVMRDAQEVILRILWLGGFFRRGLVIFCSKTLPRTCSLQSCFHFVTMRLFRVFVIRGALTLHVFFYYGSFLGALGLWETGESGLMVINSRGSTLPRQSLFLGLDRESISMLSFLKIVLIVCYSQVHILRPFRMSLCYKSKVKKDAQKCPKRPCE